MDGYRKVQQININKKLKILVNLIALFVGIPIYFGCQQLIMVMRPDSDIVRGGLKFMSLLQPISDFILLQPAALLKIIIPRGAYLADLVDIADVIIKFLMISVIFTLSLAAVHEAIHAIPLIGKGARLKIEFPFIAITNDDLVNKSRYIFSALLPLISLTLLGAALLPVLPEVGLYVAFVIITANAAGSLGDVYLVSQIMKHKRCFTKDEKEGNMLSMNIYVRE